MAGIRARLLQLCSSSDGGQEQQQQPPQQQKAAVKLQDFLANTRRERDMADNLTVEVLVQNTTGHDRFLGGGFVNLDQWRQKLRGEVDELKQHQQKFGKAARGSRRHGRLRQASAGHGICGSRAAKAYGRGQSPFRFRSDTATATWTQW